MRKWLNRIRRKLHLPVVIDELESLSPLYPMEFGDPAVNRECLERARRSMAEAVARGEKLPSILDPTVDDWPELR